MKNAKKKIVVSALALIAGASLAGSISGTIAWYQYSTSVYGAYIGTAGGTSGNLQMRIKGTNQWTTRLTFDEVTAYLDGTQEKYGSVVEPITSGAMIKNGAVEQFYRNPILGKAAYDKWEKADETNYVLLPLELRYVERDGQIGSNESKDEKNIAKKVYLSDLTIQEDPNNPGDQDISDAIRFHIASYSGAEANPTKSNFLISKNGGTTLTAGKLDLDGDGNPDKAYANDDPYGFGGSALDEIEYGEGAQVAYAASDANDLISGEYYEEDNATPVAEDDIHPILAKSYEDSLKLDNLVYGQNDTSKAIGETLADEANFLNVDITIWVEGWQKFAVLDEQGQPTGKYSSVWDASYIGSKFDVGFQFAIDPAE